MEVVSLTRLDDAFADSKSQGRLSLVAYVVAGYPDYQGTLDAISTLVDSGADVVEIGIPHSDPVADGRVLQKASNLALKGGMNPEIALELAGQARELVDVPILMMTYYNPVLQFGPERFCQRCADLGLDGMLVPDLPLEESGDLRGFAGMRDLSVICFLSTNSPRERILMTSEAATGFVYLFSILGVTGERSGVDPVLGDLLRQVKDAVPIPVCVGFGISSPAQIQALKDMGADGVVVGSGIVRRLGEGTDATGEFVRSLRGAC